MPSKASKKAASAKKSAPVKEEQPPPKPNWEAGLTGAQFEEVGFLTFDFCVLDTWLHLVLATGPSLQFSHFIHVIVN